MPENLSASQARLRDDLRGLISGDVRSDDVVLQLYSSDGSPFEERPQGVVWPRTTRDVAEVVRYAGERGTSVCARGSGSGGIGGSIGSGIVVDLSRYTRRLLQAGEDWVRVQPGAVRERVNENLRRTRGRFFAPSSGHVPVGTIGSILAVDNIGPRWLRYGAPRESVLALKVVSASGDVWDLRPFPARPTRGSLSRDGVAMQRRRFLAAALAETSDDFREWDAERDRPENGADFGDGWRSFRSERVREEFFNRTFGRENASELRAILRVPQFAATLRILSEYESQIAAEQRSRAPSRCGFPLFDVLRDGFDPTRLFVGTEGTLGIIMEATASTFAISPASGAAILLFDSLDKAARAVQAILRYEPTLCDLLDSRVVALTRDWDSRFETAFPQASEAALVVELDANSDEQLRSRMNDLLRESRDKLGSFGCWSAFSDEDKRLFRDLLRKSSCARLRMAPSFQTFPFWEDVRVPVETIPDFLRRAQEFFKRERIVYSVGGFVGAGQLSIQPILPYSEDEERRAFALSGTFESLVLECGGEIGCSKGNGRVRSAALIERFPTLFPAFVRVKDAFDPQNLLNPDCVVSPEMRRRAAEMASDRAFGADGSSRARIASDDGVLAPETDAALRESALHSRSIRKRVPFDLARLKRMSAPHKSVRPQIETQLSWDPGFAFAPTYQCVGCGHCRIRTGETRMCPAFRNWPDEQSSCRAKANLMRGALDGKLSLEALTRSDAKRVADRCIRCHCCDVECPAQVDAARLSFRLTSAYRAAVGLGVAELFAVRADFALSVAARFSGLINRGMRGRSFRWFLEKTLGVARGRKTPPLEKIPYLERLGRSGLRAPRVSVGQTAPRRKIALFIDSFPNFFDAALAEATIALFERNGVAATPIWRPRASGMVAFAIGDLDRSAEFATRNVSALREIVRDGSEIVALEPTTAVCIKKEYPYFCADADARVVYENTTDACSYLERLVRAGEFDLDALRPIASTPMRVGYHAPCRSIALSGAALSSPTAAQTLLSLVPDLEVKRLERGCCGFAGFSGFTTRRYAESLRLSARLFLATRNPGIDLCSSECSFCSLQLAQGVKKPVVHSLKLLAVAAGVMTLDEARLNAYNADRPRKKS